jgi:hypothetical protein
MELVATTVALVLDCSWLPPKLLNRLVGGFIHCLIGWGNLFSS